MSAAINQIKSSLERFAQAWKSNDGAALGSHFVEDGTLLNPFGELAAGRAAVAGMYSEYFKGMLKGTSTTFKLQTARLLGDAHALTDSEQVVTAPDGSVLLGVHICALLRRDGDTWRFVDARPYTFAELAP